MTDPWAGEQNDSVVVSIKPTTKYDSALLVFKGKDGSAVQQAVASFFGFDAASVTQQTPYETFLEAERHAKGVDAAVRGLGARVAKGTSEVASSLTGQPQASQGPSGDLTPEQELILKIMNAESKKVLGNLWAKNKLLWQNPAVDQAVQTKLKELE